MKKILLILSLLIGLNSFAQDDFFWSYSHPKESYDTIKIQNNYIGTNYFFSGIYYTYSGDSLQLTTPRGSVKVPSNTAFSQFSQYIQYGEQGGIVSKHNDLYSIVNPYGRNHLMKDISQVKLLKNYSSDYFGLSISSNIFTSSKALETLTLSETFVSFVGSLDLSNNNLLKELYIHNTPISAIILPDSPDLTSITLLQNQSLTSITFGELSSNIRLFNGYNSHFDQTNIDKILKYFVDSNRNPFELGTSPNDGIDLCGIRNAYPSATGYGYVSILTSRGWSVCVNNNATTPIVSTDDATMINSTSATIGGNASSDGGAAITARGVAYGTSANPTTAGSHTSLGTGVGLFSSNVTGLSSSTLYHMRAYATNSNGTSYGADKTFTTTNAIQTVPELITTVPTSVTTTTASSGGTITFDGNYEIIEKGVCWSTSPSPNTSNSKTNNGNGTDSYTSSITGLSPNTTYYLRAYATNRRDAGGSYVYATGYGQEEVFMTASSSECDLPTVTTNAVNSITTNSAIGGGNITSDGNCEVTIKGVCWSTAMNPTTANSHTTDGSGTGSFSSSITGLACGFTYYARAYATNSSGTAYGNQVSFTTLCVAPTVSLATISGITSTTANTALTITNTGGCTVLVSSIQWSVNSDFTGSVSSGPNTTGSYTITGLSPNTTYYVRGYASNNTGDTYTATQSFTTSGSCVAPTLATTTATGITTTTATGGGNVTSDGGCAVTARGVVYSTSPNPTISSHVGGGITSNGTGTGSFTSSITGLTCGTTYYARAYATNSSGTAYGDAVSFTTGTIDPCLLSVGDSYGGGKIAYFFQSGDNGYVSGECHGIIAAASDLYDSDYGSYYSWALGSLIYCGATGSAIGTGELNTELIYNHYSSYIHTAAVMCYNLTLNGYSDWILGSRFDMFAIWSNKALVGGFSDAYYWTSTEDGTNNAVSIYMGNSSIDSKNKYNSIRVRAIRYF